VGCKTLTINQGLGFPQLLCFTFLCDHNLKLSMLLLVC